MEIESCVYKLNCGNKYVIIKGKTLSGSLYFIQNGYALFLAAGGGIGNRKGGIGQKEWDDSNSYYKKLYRYIKKNPQIQLTISILLESNDAFELLKREYDELQRSIRDKKCLNSNVTSYIPKFKEKTGMYGWISAADVERFQQYITQI